MDGLHAITRNRESVLSCRNGHSLKIYPNYHTPDWAKGCGDVSDFLWIDSAMEIRPTMWKSDEYAYIGEHSEKVTDWSKTPAVMGV